MQPCKDPKGFQITKELESMPKDACYKKVMKAYKGKHSAYASGSMVKCRKVGAKNWGNKTKKGGR
jgi:hypothetical protein